MSWEATAWAKRTRGHRSHAEARVLLVLADYAQPNTHEAWPSQQALADDCEMSDRNVRYCLDSLTKRGFLSVVRKGNQYQPTLYQLAVAQESEPEIQRTGDVSELPPASGAQAYEPEAADPGILADRGVNRKGAASEPEISDSEPEIAISVEPPLRAAIEPPVSPYERAFEVLREIPRWPRPREPAAEVWMARDEITADEAYGAALSLKSLYNPTKHKDLVATLAKWSVNEQTWAKERRNGNGERGRHIPADRIGGGDDGWGKPF